jgi:hypothetical protein
MIEDEEIPLASEEASTEEEVSTEEEETSVESEPVSTEEEEPVLTKRAEGTIQKHPSIQRAADGKTYTSADLAQQIARTKGQGGSLPTEVQQEFGSKMGADFSDIKLHTDNSAIQMNKALGSHAFTQGKDIYFNSGKYNPESFEGKYLLAHELTHTMQQNNAIVRRLTVSPVGSFAKRACGGFRRFWKFELDNPAPNEGYMVQQIDWYEDIKNCPQSARCLAKPTLTFWEAWRFNKGDTLFAQFSSIGFSDMSSSGSANKKTGYRLAFGTIKFFSKSTTGDLGDLRTPPTTPNGGWGPGNEPQSGILPSTKTRPSWWSSSPIEGPATRLAESAWRCCGDSGDFNTIKARP